MPRESHSHGFPDIGDAALALFLRRVVGNILDKPTEAKFRSLNTAVRTWGSYLDFGGKKSYHFCQGAAFAKVRDSPAAVAFLKALGFVDRDSKLVLDDADVNLDKLRAGVAHLSSSEGMIVSHFFSLLHSLV
jgi:hypothetical protein